MRRLVMTAFFAAFVLAGSLAVAGDKPDKPDKPAESTKPAKPVPPHPTSSPAALSLFRAAVAYQGPKALAKEGAIQDLTVKISGEVWDYTGAKPEEVSMKVTRYLKMDPKCFRSEWRTTAGVDIYGYDGTRPAPTRFWYASYNSLGTLQSSRFLTGDRYKRDRQRIVNEMAETKYLLRFFFLANLEGPDVAFARKPDVKLDSLGGTREAHVLTRDNYAPGSKEPPLTLWFDAKTNALLRAEAHATGKGQKSLIFRFQYNEAVQPRVKGVLFPFKIETREKPFGATKDRISNTATIEPNGIDFNSGLPSSTFTRPH